MPTYEYECNECEKRTELRIGSFETNPPPTIVCPRCEGRARRVFCPQVEVIIPRSFSSGEEITRVTDAGGQTTEVRRPKV